MAGAALAGKERAEEIVCSSRPSSPNNGRDRSGAGLDTWLAETDLQRFQDD